MRILVFSSIRLFGEGVAACLDGEEGVEATTCCHRAGDVLDASPILRPTSFWSRRAAGGLREGRALAAACPDIPIVALALADASSDVIACADADS